MALPLGYPNAIMKMRKTAAALAIFVGLAPATALGQSSIVSQVAGDKAATERLHFGLTFGLSCGKLSGMDAERFGGFSLGLAATIRLTARLSLVAEVVPFSRRGAASIPFATTGDPDLDPYFADPTKSALVLDYIDIPVLVKYRVGRFDVGAGAFAGFLNKATERFRADLETGTAVEYTKDVTEDYRDVDYGFVLEGSWTITRPRRGMGLILHVRYQAGLTDIPRESSWLAVLVPAVRASSLRLFLSFPFVL
jgi:hypothetical protein